MEKALLSLWLLGAPTYTANVVILSRSPSLSGGAVAECVEPKEPPINVTDVAKTVRPTEAGPAKTERTGTANESSSAPTADRSAAVDSPAVTPPKDAPITIGPRFSAQALPGAAPRWALGEDRSSQSSSDTRDDRPAAAPREHTPSLADTYLRRFYRGY